MMTVPAFRSRKSAGPPLVVLTAYDAMTASVAEAAGVDAILVGDSLGMVEMGYDSTLPVTMDDMLHHARSVGRRRKSALLIADMPWLSYHLGTRAAVENAARFVREAGADAVKIEGGRKRLDVVHALLDAEIPVMGHVGPDRLRVVALPALHLVAPHPEHGLRREADAEALAGAGVFSIVLEGIPAALARAITGAVGVPTIGIGAGPGCDGQVLVIHDMLGMLPGPVPKFVRRYADLHEIAAAAAARWADDVRARTFPGENESYG